MNTRKNLEREYGISEHAVAFAVRVGLVGVSSGDMGLRMRECVQRLTTLGLTSDEIADVEMRQPMLQAICEYARADAAGRDESETAMVVLGAALRVIADEIQRLDLDLEMLNLRKHALMRRARVLRKIEFALQAEDEGLLAA